VAWQAFWSSRLVVWLAGIAGVLSIGRRSGTAGFDPRNLTAPFGYFGNLLVAPSARWDSAWYLAIAQNGYGHDRARAAFYPVYPFLTRALGFVIRSNLVAGILISLIAFLVALVLLHRLVALELGQEVARVAVLLIAFFPTALFFSAVYSESLYLALSLGAVLAARSGRWAWAGVLGAVAAAERPTGVVLVVAIVLMYLYGPRTDRFPDWSRAGPRRSSRLLPRYRPRWSIAWAALVPVGLGAYLLYMALSFGDGLAPLRAHALWGGHFAGPFGAVWQGAVAAWDGLRQLLHGPPPPVYFPKSSGNPLAGAENNLMLFGFLVVGAIALAGALRRLPVAYGAYTLVALALPLSFPVTPQPLQSISRYELVQFPLFMWGAWWLHRRRLTTPAIAAFAVLLGALTVQFATWRFIA
jgi:hypothetical protein